MFHTAAVWRYSSNLETGNFVLPGHGAETQVSESRMYGTTFLLCLQMLIDRCEFDSQWELNSYCQLSYAIDTQHDKSIWDAQKVRAWLWYLFCTS